MAAPARFGAAAYYQSNVDTVWDNCRFAHGEALEGYNSADGQGSAVYTVSTSGGTWSNFTGCTFEAKTIGHPGLDYGSGFPLIGFVPALNLSYALGSNTGEETIGMNFTLGAMDNAQLIRSASCPFIEAAVKAQLPGFPDFKCY